MLRLNHYGDGIIRGMAVTFKYIFRKPVTTQYPEERLVVSRRIRGNILGWSMDKCTGCYTCERNCPHGCIEIKTNPASKQRKISAPCTQTCPSNVDAARYIRCLAEGKPDEAVAVVRERIPFPSVCAYICPAPCEMACIRRPIDEAIAIRMLKRYAVDNGADTWKSRSRIAPPSGKSVAVIGAGPTGLTVAYYLAKLGGHAVTIFEDMPKPGGTMLTGIPRYRLPENILMRDIQEIQDVGVEIKTGHRIHDPQYLLEQGFDAVFIGIGTQKPTRLGVNGEDDMRVLGGIDFLRNVSLGKKITLGKKVVVIGGGNTAFDSARTAIRLGADDVSILYRRTRREIPASHDEVEHAMHEGVKINFLTAPLKIISDNNNLKLHCIRMKIGEVDESGRGRPQPIEDSEFILEPDRIITAIGQQLDTSSLPANFHRTTAGTLAVNPNTLETSVNGIFAGGDVVTGPGIVIEAITTGRLAAISIDKYLGGSGNIDEVLAEPEGIIERYGKPVEGIRPEIGTIPQEKRVSSFDLVEKEWNREAAMTEVERCLRCDLKYDVQQYQLDGGLCIYCGLCVESCPFDALYMGYSYERTTYRFGEQILQKEDLLTPDVIKVSAYAHTKIEDTLPGQTLLVDREEFYISKQENEE